MRICRVAGCSKHIYSGQFCVDHFPSGAEPAKKYVYVLMANDYPEGATADEDKAEEMFRATVKKYTEARSAVFVRLYRYIDGVCSTCESVVRHAATGGAG